MIISKDVSPSGGLLDKNCLAEEKATFAGGLILNYYLYTLCCCDNFAHCFNVTMERLLLGNRTFIPASSRSFEYRGNLSL
jgi:hypothetical protein